MGTSELWSTCRNRWPDYDGELVNMEKGPFLTDVAMHNVSDASNDAAADPNGCAALHPFATYAIRLLFASSVHERGSNGTLLPFGTNATAAAKLFSLHTGYGYAESPDTVVGVADVDDDSVVDLCVKGASRNAHVDSVFINCTAAVDAAAELLSANGTACTEPIVRAFTPLHTLCVCVCLCVCV